MSDRNDTDTPVQRYKLTIAYDGSGFHGWQKQHPPESEPLRTVQQVVEDALKDLLKQRINLLGASRTDAGVHAKGQVAQFDAASPIPLERMREAINGRLPADVEVRKLEVVPASFDAIKDVTTKRYLYRLHNAAHRPLEKRHVVYHCWVDLDVDRMNEAAARLIGTHDFEGFSAAGHGRTSTVRTIHHCAVERADDEVHIIVEGDGFLYNMIRIIAGTLVEVGRGAMDPERIDRVLETRDRQLAGPTLPPQGLCLEWIRYE